MCEALLHAGDLARPETLKLLASAGLPVYYVMGNHEEGYEEQLVSVAEANEVKISSDIGQFTIGGRKIACTHYPEVAERLTMFGGFDLICFGHSHVASVRKLPKGTILLNPGNLAGWRQPPSYAVYDTEKHKATLFPLEFRKTHYSFPEE